MGLLYENVIPGGIMIEKNKKLADSESKVIMGMRSSNLPLNLIVDDFSEVENDIKRDTKMNLKWNKPKAQSILTKSNAENSSFNSTLERNDDLNGAKIDPNINDLNKKCKNLSLQEGIPTNPSQESEDTSKPKTINLKEIELKLISDLVNFLKKLKNERHALNKEDKETESNEKGGLRARGHVKKSSEKTRSTPFDRSNKSSTTSAERLQVAGTPSLTLTTNDGRALVYVKNDSRSMDTVPEQNCNSQTTADLFEDIKQVLTNDDLNEVLSSDDLLGRMIEHYQSMLNEAEGGDLHNNSAFTESQVLNIQLDRQPNSLNQQYHPQYTLCGTHATQQSPLHQSYNSFSPQNGETNIGSMVSVNSFRNKSPQQNFSHHSPQQNANITPLVLNQKPFTNYSPQHSTMAPLNRMHSPSLPQSFKIHSPPHISLIHQPSVTKQSPQQANVHFSPQLNNTVTKSISSTCTMYSPHKSPPTSQFFINTPQHNESKVSPILQRSPYTQTIISPNTSPGQSEQADSCYDTNSPSGSSAVTSPGSPSLTSYFSSESDQDFSPGEPHYLTATNITNHKTAHFVQKHTTASRAGPNKNKQTIKPLGEIINTSTKSAEQTLNELCNCNSWKEKYIIQLVRVTVSTQKYPNDCVRGFRENLMQTIYSQVDKKSETLWKLAIFVHLQFLKAPARVEQYKHALLKKDAKEQSLLYIVAVQRNCPLIARCIAEIMHQVGFNPAEVDASGSSIVHLLAHLGDSHAEVLAELLAASDSRTGKKLFDAQATNKEGKSLLHIAASSTQPKSTTIVLLIAYGIDTKLQDKFNKIALQYHLQAMVSRRAGSQWQPEDRELAKKLLPPSTNQSSEILERLGYDPSTPMICHSLIEDLKRVMR